MRGLVGAVCLLFVVRSALAAPAVEAFSPQGEVKQVRQVTARFASQMVAFGDLRAADPFDVECPEKGRGRWIDSNTWSYDFERDLPGAVACRFLLRAGAHDLAGQPLAGERVFSFTTGGPAVLRALPGEGSTVDENQVFILALDAPADDESIGQHAWCQADGVNEKIGVRVLAGQERERFLALRREFVQRHLSIYFKARGVVWRATTPLRRREKEALPVAVLQCQRALPPDTLLRLVWGAGIGAANGIASGHDQKLAFRTRPDFSATLTCNRVHAKAGCIAFLPIRLWFSAPVAARDARAMYLQGPDGKRYPAQAGKEEEKAEYLQAVSFAGPFPEKAGLSLHLPPGLKDDAGRELVNRARFPLPVRTAEHPPLVKFAAPFGIVEARGDRMLPVTVRNVEPSLAARLQTVGASVRAEQDEEVIGWLGKLAGRYFMDLDPAFQYGDELRSPLLAKEPKADKFALPRPNGRRAFEVIGIPLKRPGFYVVELASPRLGQAINKGGATAYVHSAALVTNMAAHFKRGAQSSLVWVTSLDKARPVAGVDVAVRTCGGALLWSGKSGADGVAHIERELPESRCGYFVSARRAGDFTFTLSTWQRGIETWRFNVQTAPMQDDASIAATVFDRTLLRAGETVHMKHFLRRHTPGGLVLPGPGGADKVLLVHQGSGEQVEQPLHWDASGAAQGEWKIPEQARLGVYEVMIGGRVAGQFRVEQFRVPTMRAVLAGPKEVPVAPAELALDAQVSYLSGGPASDMPVTLRTLVEPKGVSFDGYDDFSFAAGDVKEGAVKEGAAFDDDEGEWEETGPGGPLQAARTQQRVLDRAGGARIVVDKLPQRDRPASLLAELSWQDANGETQTVSTRVPLMPSQYVVGLQPDGWMLSRDALKFKVAVLDLAGKPVPGAQVAVDLFQRATYSHRRRLVGGFYAYENAAEIKRLGAACEGSTDDKGVLACQIRAPAEGNLILRAQAHDAAGRPWVTTRDVWVAGREDTWFAVSDNDRIDLLPSKKRFEPGEEASFQVRSPFREATALVTVEREGIVDTYVRRLSGARPVFTIPVKGNYAPNVFVSALLVRGRVAAPAPTALVDLGKPAYKLGIAPVRVGWAAHELKVQVTADKPVYKVRERAAVRVRVTGPDGRALPAGAEVALAAVDQGLLELMPNASWELLEAMMGERGLQVRTSTAQMQVVGKRHFGRKAFAHGGGGGRSGARELFDTLLLWRGKVPLDANGEAAVEVPLNDSLTSFRIVAVASAGAGLFGTGHADVRSTQDLMLLSGLPTVVREGDRLRAGFTVRNLSGDEMKVRLGARVAADRGKQQELAAQDVVLAPGQARELGWDYTVPQAALLQWEVEARAQGASDRLRVGQKVGAAVPVRTLQATLLQLDGPRSMKVERPAGALPGHGGVAVSFSPKLGGDMAGVRDYMSRYPYTCLEQVTSQAIALRDPMRWKAVLAALPSHLDGDGLAKYFATMDEGSDALTAYLLSISREAGYEIPASLRGRMEEGLAAFVAGRLARGSPLATGELAVRKLAALEALSRSGHVQPAMLESFTIEPNLWPTSAVIDWYLVLQRTEAIPAREARLAQAEAILRARLNLQGTTMGFSTERSDDWWWLMASPDVNANRLLLAMLGNPRWRQDMGRLARGTLGRQQRGHWRGTLANAWGVLALEKFGNHFESQPVTGAASAQLAGGWPQPAAYSGAVPSAVLLAWPERGGELSLRHDGGGKPWATVQSQAAVPLTSPISSGYRIVRTVTPVERKHEGAWTRGDVLRVHLDLEAQSDMTWVVVDDPVPAGSTILGSGLARDSAVATSGERARGWVQPAFVERKADAFRAYFEFVPKGNWSVEYTVRLNNEGRFALPPTHVEAMYSPEMFGDIPNAPVIVGR
jgi:alpha-2-macroglobulin